MTLQASVVEFMTTARSAGAVAGPFATKREAVLFRSRANTYRRRARETGDTSLDRLVIRVTHDNLVVAAPAVAPPIRPLEASDADLS